MQQHKSIVYVVDDDPSVRRSLGRLLESVGHSVEISATAEELLGKRPLEAGCLVLDVRLPGLSGFELYDRLMAGGNPLPVIFVTAHYDETMKKRAEAMGALGYLEKPIVDDTLINMINVALNRISADPDQI